MYNLIHLNAKRLIDWWRLKWKLILFLHTNEQKTRVFEMTIWLCNALHPLKIMQMAINVIT